MQDAFDWHIDMFYRHKIEYMAMVEAGPIPLTSSQIHIWEGTVPLAKLLNEKIRLGSSVIIKLDSVPD